MQATAANQGLRTHARGVMEMYRGFLFEEAH
jgi:hypothetical protein